jgi:hypothetical protein
LVRLFEGEQALAEPVRVLLRDGEDADTALGAAGFADQVRAAATVGVGYGSVNDLNEQMVPPG